jgi:hypothetical protein
MIILSKKKNICVLYNMAEWGKLTREQADSLSKAELQWMSNRYKQLRGTSHKARPAQAAAVTKEELKVHRGWGGEPLDIIFENILSKGLDLPKQKAYPQLSSTTISPMSGGKQYIKLQKGGRRLIRYGKKGGKYYMKGGSKIYIK